MLCRYGWKHGFPDYPTRPRWDEESERIHETISSWQVLYYHQKDVDDKPPLGSWLELIGADKFYFDYALPQEEVLPDVFKLINVTTPHAFGMLPGEIDEQSTPPGKPQRGVAAYRTYVPGNDPFSNLEKKLLAAVEHGSSIWNDIDRGNGDLPSTKSESEKREWEASHSKPSLVCALTLLNYLKI